MDTYTGTDQGGDQGQDDSGSGDSGYTCYLPADFPGADDLKAGDEITLKVVGKDKDGDLEVEHVSAGDEGQGDYMSDLETTMGGSKEA